MVESFESSLIVLSLGSVEAVLRTVIASVRCSPESCVELRTCGVLLRGGLGSSDNCSKQTMWEFYEINDVFGVICEEGNRKNVLLKAVTQFEKLT